MLWPWVQHRTRICVYDALSIDNEEEKRKYTYQPRPGWKPPDRLSLSITNVREMTRSLPDLILTVDDHPSSLKALPDSRPNRGPPRALAAGCTATISKHDLEALPQTRRMVPITPIATATGPRVIGGDEGTEGDGSRERKGHPEGTWVRYATWYAPPICPFTNEDGTTIFITLLAV